MIGIDKWFNTDNQHKDQEIVKTGGANFRKTWALMDSKNILYIDDYPLLFEVLKAEDRGDGTLRHIRYGDTRELGTFETDAMQSHVHSNTHNHTANPHDHDMSHQHNYSAGNRGLFLGAWYADMNQNYSKDFGDKNTLGGRNRTDSQTVVINNTTITTDTGTGKSANETRMKNTAGQWYILAKVTYFS